MKTWRYDRRGKPNEVLKLHTDVPIPPAPKAGEVLIRVSYVALNPADYKLMEFRVPFRYPATPGIDFVGEIIQVGTETSESQTKVHIGMTVAGSVLVRSIVRGAGTLAEYIVLPVSAVVEKPKDLPEAVAAGLLGVAGQTSAMLFKSTKFSQGNKVLLNGASGGVGCVLIQVLRAMGVQVTAICSARNAALVRRLGAEEVRLPTFRAFLSSHIADCSVLLGYRLYGSCGFVRLLVTKVFSGWQSTVQRYHRLCRRHDPL